MTDLATAPPPAGHNRPPVVAPTIEEIVDDLKRRYPELETKIAQFEASLAKFPKALTLADAEVAGALQDLLAQMRDQRAAWDGIRKSQKKPWDNAVKAVQNFFTKGQDKLDQLDSEWRPRYQVFLDLKTAENARKAEEAAEAQRKEAKRLADEAEAAAQRKLEAEAREADARKREDEARARAAAAEKEQREAEARAEAARAEERRLADEKRVRDRRQKEAEGSDLNLLRANMKGAERLHELAEAQEATEFETSELDNFIKSAGTVGARLLSATMLEPDETKDLFTMRTRLGELRQAVNDRHDAAERKRREKAAQDAEAAETAAAAERARKRAEEDAEAERTRLAREEAEAAAAAAKQAQKGAQADVRAARTDQRQAIAGQKAAGRDEKRLGTDAERADNRADRLERKVEESSDADHSRTRGDVSVGGITGRWIHQIEDEEALRTVCGPLGPHFTEDALSGAAYRWMAAHRDGFPKDAERVEGQLAGVVFIWERNVAIR